MLGLAGATTPPLPPTKVKKCYAFKLIFRLPEAILIIFVKCGKWTLAYPPPPPKMGKFTIIFFIFLNTSLKQCKYFLQHQSIYDFYDE